MMDGFVTTIGPARRLLKLLMAGGPIGLNYGCPVSPVRLVIQSAERLTEVFQISSLCTGTYRTRLAAFRESTAQALPR